MLALALGKGSTLLLGISPLLLLGGFLGRSLLPDCFVLLFHSHSVGFESVKSFDSASPCCVCGLFG